MVQPSRPSYQFFADADHGTLICGGDADVVASVSPAFEAWSGRAAGELKGRPALDLFAGDPGEELRLAHAQDRRIFEAEIRRKDRPPARSLVSVTRAPGLDPERPYRILTFYDVDRLQGELADLFDNAPVGIRWVDLDGTILRANRAELDLLGYPAEAYVGRPMEAFHADPAEARDILDRLRREGSLRDYAVRLRARDGSIKDVLLNADVLGEDGRVRFLNRDVTARVRSEQAMRFLADADTLLASSLEVEATLANLVRLAVPRLADWSAVHARENGGAVQRLAVSHADPRKIGLLEELLDRYPPAPGSLLKFPQVIETGKTEFMPEIPAGQLRDTARSEEHAAMLHALGLRALICVPLEARGRIFGALTLAAADPRRAFDTFDLDLARELAVRAALAVDNARLYRDSRREVAERSKVEAELKLLNASLERRVKERADDLDNALQELRSFSYTVAHDLRAPLRAITTLSDILRDDYAGKTFDATAQGYLNGIGDASLRMDYLIHGLLAYYELASAEVSRGPVEPQAALDRCLAAMGRELKERRARVDVIHPLPPVTACERTLADVLCKLVSNAIIFVAPGVEPHVRIWAERRGLFVRLCVQDNGLGIAQEYHERIFRVFERLHRMEDYPGAGIGLALARKAIERMGGRIGLESKVGEGSRFWIDLPASA
ncbi:MAG TPA: ATP-binding protein [Planctomycetota bacterium]